MNADRVKRFTLLIVLVAVISSLSFVQAQQTMSIAVFDFQKTVEGSLEGKKAISQIKTKEQIISSDLGKRSNNIVK